jgi:hypothetical protein
VLTVTDNSGLTDTASVVITVTGPPTTIHVGDLDGSSAAAGANRWNATVTIRVHKADHSSALAGVVVSGSWGGGTSGSGSCTTDAAGQCSVTKSNLKGNLASVTFTVSNLSQAGSTYVASSNHDPEADSNGTTITVRR